MPCLMALEADFRGFFYTAPDRHERGVFQLDLQEENEVLEQFDVLEKKELGIALGEEAEVKQSPKRGLAEVVGVLVSVFRLRRFPLRCVGRRLPDDEKLNLAARN